jgi:hypothetical protein
MSMEPKEDKLYVEVDALSEETKDTLIPNGETWQIKEFAGSAAFIDDTVSCIVWDPAGTPRILDCTHGEKKTGNLNEMLVGDGVKVLRISLQNDTNTARVLGCKWEGRKL